MRGLGYVLSEGWFFLLLALLLGLFIGWLIWGRSAVPAGQAEELARLRSDLDSCQSKGRDQAARITALQGEVSAANAAAKSAAEAAAASASKAEASSADMTKSGPAMASAMGSAPAAGFVSAVPVATAPVKEAAAKKPAAPKAAALKAAPKAAAPKAAAAATAAAKPAAKPAAAPKAAKADAAKSAAPAAAKPAAAPKAPAKAKEPTKPKTLTAPRGGKADDLKLIKGVGPKMEALLHKLGFFHFDQMAAWTAKDVAWVDENLEDFKGRATREEWVQQAKDLAAGKPPRKGGEN